MKLFVFFALFAISLACEREDGCCGRCGVARLRKAIEKILGMGEREIYFNWMGEREECEEKEEGCCGRCGRMQERLNQMEKDMSM